jgi:signal transduction histidine kinase
MLERPGTRRALIPYLLCLAALSLTASGARYAGNTAAVEDRLRFGNAAEQLRSEMVHRVDAYVSMLLGAAGLFAASETVEVREFRSYVERLELPRRYPGVQGVGFSRLIKDEELSTILALRRQDVPTFRFWPNRQDGPRHAILYLEPMDQRNSPALGYDMSTEPVRLEAMDRARDSGEPTSTALVTLIQERLDSKHAQAGFLIYVPVYQHGTMPENIEQRRRTHVGFVYSLFRGTDFLSGILEERGLSAAGLQFEVYNGSAEEDLLLYRSSAVPPAPMLTSLQTIDVVGRQWTLLLRSAAGFAAGGRRAFTNLVIGAGVFLSLLLFVVTRSQVKARAVAEHAADELRRSEEALRAANEAKDEFLATVSHELRTPLNAIVGWAHMLRKGQVPAESRDHALEVISRNAAAQTTLIEDLLDVSRAVEGRLPLKKADVDLGPLLKVALDSLEPAARARDLTMVSRVPSNLGVVFADAGRVQQVILNLLSNAVKFTPAGGRITLSADAGTDVVTIRVSDTGAGIAPEMLARVFERFWQADKSTTRRYSGVGLGLTISRHLVELHGGTIEAASEGEGHGTTITVQLPRRP